MWHKMSGQIICRLSLWHRQLPDCFLVLSPALFAAYLGAALANVLSVVSQRGLRTCLNTLPPVPSAPQSQCKPVLQKPFPSSSVSSRVTLLASAPARQKELGLSRLKVNTGQSDAIVGGLVGLFTEGHFEEHYLVTQILSAASSSPSRTRFKSFYYFIILYVYRSTAQLAYGPLYISVWAFATRS